MSKKISLVGHCGPDSSYLRLAINRAVPGVQLLAADDDAELKRQLDAGLDLILFNRELDYGFDERLGVELIRKLSRHYPQTAMVLVSNYAEAQQAAVQAGGLPGFGKRELGTPRVTQVLKEALAAVEVAAAS